MTQSMSDKLSDKYSTVKTPPSVASNLDRRVSSYQSKSAQRVGSRPQVDDQWLSESMAEMTGIKKELVELLLEYEQNTGFFDAITKSNSYLRFDDRARIAGLYALGIIRGSKWRNAKINETHIDAAHEMGTDIEGIVNDVSKTSVKIQTKAQDGYSRVEGLKTRAVNHIMYLEDQMIEGLRDSFKGTGQDIELEYELADLRNDLIEMQTAIESESNKLKEYRAKLGDPKTDEQYLNSSKESMVEITKLLDIKKKMLHGQIAKEGKMSDLRKQLLDSAACIKSANENLVVARENYLELNLNQETFSDYETMYKYMNLHMMENMKLAAASLSSTMEAARMGEFAKKLSNSARRLQHASAVASVKGPELAFDLLSSAKYDVQESLNDTEMVQTFYNDLIARKKQMAEEVLSSATSVESLHFQQHE